jgi:hypothetical protein
VFRCLDVVALDIALGQWAQRVLAALRGTWTDTVPGLHRLAAVNHRLGLALAQVPVGEKTNEIPPAHTLLGMVVLRTPGVSPTNNLAERALRPQVVVRKISGGSRNPTASLIRCDLATLFHTWAARDLNPLAACLEALQTALPQV